jgi:ATP-dependent Zn protease
VIKRIAVCLGGIVAEELVFGEENITRGGGDDIEEATDYATRAVKEYGMGSLPGAIDVSDPSTRNQYHDLNGDHNAEVKKLLLQGRELAMTILN